MGLEWYESDGTTAVTATHAFGSVAAGATSSAWEPWLYYNKGTAGGQAASVKLQIEALDGATWLRSGLSVLDQYEVEVRIKGYAATGDSTFVGAVTTGRTRIGTSKPFSVGTIPGNCGVQLEIVYAPRLQSGTASTDVTVQFPTVYNEITTALVPGIAESAGIGILTDGTEWVQAPLATETGTPDDYVQISRGWWGRGRNLASSHQLDQNDSAAAALGSGEAYYALISQPIAGGARVATKGVKAAAASAVVPALPADSLPIATVLVAYGAGGTVIETADIEQIATDGRMLVSDTTGLDVSVAPGRAITSTSLVERTLAETITVTDDATSTVWLTAQGTLSIVSGDIPLATVVAASADIVSVTDIRRYSEPGCEVIRLHKTGDEATATAVATAYLGRRCRIDRVTMAARTASTGATGATTCDVNYGGTTIFTNQGGSIESRPSIAAQGTSDLDAYPEVTDVGPGWLSLDIDAITSGGTRAADVEVLVWTLPR
jgi:hypothetical protein